MRQTLNIMIQKVRKQEVGLNLLLYRQPQDSTTMSSYCW